VPPLSSSCVFSSEAHTVHGTHWKETEGIDKVVLLQAASQPHAKLFRKDSFKRQASKSPILAGDGDKEQVRQREVELIKRELLIQVTLNEIC